jgi:hypothetical protein
MGRWYKIPKDSPTGKRLQAISDRMDVFQKAWLKFREKYGIKSCTYYSEHLCDALAMDFDHEPDAAIWHQLKRGDLKGLYKPYKNTDAYKEWQQLRKLRVERIELDHAMGDPTNFPDVGIHWGHEDYFFVHYRFRPDYPLGEECEFISDKEYKMMTGDTSDWNGDKEELW